MLTVDNVALFIGVDDYSAFDASMHEPPGTSDLLGSRNDAHAFWRVCRGIGIPPENLRILTSPALDAADLGAPAESVGVATEAAVLEGLAWLAGRLGGEGRPPGLLTYSGHGSFVEGEGLVLCPSDVTGPNLEHAISFSAIDRAFVDRQAAARLTVVLDCCHAGASEARPGRRATSLTRRALPPALAEGAPALGDRELAACRAGGTAWQSRFSGVHRGAFSWAVAAVLEQWQPRLQGSHVEISLSYGQLLARARRLLETLSFDQVPVLRGRPGVARIPFFHCGPGASGEVSLRPDRQRRGGQLDPNMRYRMELSTSNQPWLIYATGDTKGDLTSYTEYWQLGAQFVSALQGAASITFSGEPLSGSPSPTTGFAMPTDSLWVPMGSAPQGSASAFWSEPIEGSQQTYVVGLALGDLAAPSESSAVWSGAVTWYVGTTGGAPPEYVLGGGTVTLTSGPAPGSGYTWYSMTLPPLTWSASVDEIWGSCLGASLAQLGGTQYVASLVDQLGIQVGPLVVGASGSAYVGVAYSASAPSLAALGDTLYVAYQGYGEDTVYLASSTAPATTPWSRLGTTGIETTSAPALTADGRTLYMACFPSGSTIYVGSSEDGATWQTLPGAPQLEVAGAPALAAFDGALYLAVTTSASPAAIQVYRWSAASGWSAAPVTTLEPLAEACPGGLCDPGLGVFNGRLYLACRDASSTNLWLCSTADGTNWTGYEELTLQLPSACSGGAPALGAVGSTLTLAFVDPDGTLSTWPTLVSA